MLISEIIQHIKHNNLMPCKIRHSKFAPKEYIDVSDEYPNFYTPVFPEESEGQLIHWYPGLEDLMANDWEIIKT